MRALGEWKLTGAYRKAFHTESLRVLFVVSSFERDKRRVERIKTWTEAEGGENLFWFAALNDLSPAALFRDRIWLVASRPGKSSLL